MPDEFGSHGQCDNCGSGLDSDRTCPQPRCAGIEDWVAELIDALDLNIIRTGTVYGTRSLFACMDDCTCLFTVDDGDFLDRFSLVSDAGSCVFHQECPCHLLPRRNPATYPSEMTAALRNALAASTTPA